MVIVYRYGSVGNDGQTAQLAGACVTITKSLLWKQKAFSRELGCDWLMFKHQPITVMLSAKRLLALVTQAPGCNRYVTIGTTEKKKKPINIHKYVGHVAKLGMEQNCVMWIDHAG